MSRGKKLLKDFFHFHPSNYLQQDKKHKLKLKRRGLEYFRYFFLPASGPKGFVSSALETKLKALYKRKQLRAGKWLVGGSTGALRSCALISSLLTNTDVTWQLKEHYCEMHYKHGDTFKTLQPMMEELYTICAPTQLIPNILKFPEFRLAIMVADIHPWYHYLPDYLFKGVLAGVALANFITPDAISMVCKRICFYTGPDVPEFAHSENITFYKLTKDNFHQVLHATTCIPFVSPPCNYIEGVGKGKFIDGGLTDYYLNISIKNCNTPALLAGDLVPGEPVHRSALDPFMPFKRHLPQYFFDNCSVIRPSEAYLQALPEDKLPGISDWFNEEYIQDPLKRRHYWETVYNLSQDHWHKALEKV
ncbi:hypothetical protein HDV01_007728 [Terramyces sp. JEL0728]|nr:hypothetical protein HDV01_007728 [Terramyces sp. JEL0728]